MHYELDLTGSGIQFHCGDSFGVLPSNPPSEVDGVLEATGLDGEAPVGSVAVDPNPGSALVVGPGPAAELTLPP